MVEDINRRREEADAAKWQWLSWAKSFSVESTTATTDSEQRDQETFPYLVNYDALISLEYFLLRGVGASFEQIIFIGSGPLPLSSLILARDHLAHLKEPARIINIDDDVEALALGASLTSAVLSAPLVHSSSDNTSSLTIRGSSSTTISFHPLSALDLPPALLTSSSLIVLAALVGLVPATKLSVALYAIAHMRIGSHMLLRSAEGLRSIIYPEVDEDELVRRAREAGTPVKIVSFPLRRKGQRGLTAWWLQVVVAHPRNEVVNTVIIVQRVN